VSLLSEERDGVAFDALCSENDSEWKLQRFEHWALLDVELKVSGGVALFGSRIGDLIDIDATVF
jgi:hypothetical protein